MWRLFLLIIPLAGLCYTLWHVWWLLPFPPAFRTASVAVLALCFLCLVPSMTKWLDRLPMPAASAVYMTGTTSLIVLLYSTLLFFVLDLLSVFRLLPPGFLKNNAPVSAVMTVFLAALLLSGNICYHHKKRREILLTTDKAVKDTRILMMSDCHLGYHIRRKELAGWVDMINRENPDLVLLAGDLVDRSVRPLIEDGMAAELRRIKAPVFACPGNHEYYAGKGESAEFYSSAGITLLSDSAAEWRGFTIAGRDDRTNPRRKSVGELLSGAGSSSYVILLDHQPWNLGEAARAGADFQLSGHTHHGQVFPVSLITDAVYEKACGEYSLGATRYFISSGMGIWGGKYRIGTRSEYAVATVKAR